MIEIRKVILVFPPTPNVRQDMAGSLKDLTNHYGVLGEVNFEKRTLTVTTLPHMPRLERVFSPIGVAKLIQGGLTVKICYCPEGTKAVAVTFPEKGWDRRDPQILRGYYDAEGYKTKMDSKERKLVLEARTAELDDLPFRRFIEKGYKVKFIT